MGDCVICNKPLYETSVCDLCKPVVDKVRELQSKNKKWFEELYDRNRDMSFTYYNSYLGEEIDEEYMTRDKFTSILMDLLKMKQAVFLICDYGCDGKAKESIIYASTNEDERDDFFSNDPNKAYYLKVDRVYNLDQIAQQAWNRLDGLEKLALERTNCILWKEKPQSKHSV